ncbi:MAG: M20/M25/M40 family metallo-hydrolase, partial [Bacillota bacterium]
VQLAAAAARSLNLFPKMVSSGGGSDANIFNQHGIACANLGIGMQKVHTTEEFIKVEDLVNSARLVLEIIRLANEVNR